MHATLTATPTGEPTETPTAWADDYEPNDSCDDAWGPLLPAHPYRSYIWSRTDEDYFYIEALSLDPIWIRLDSPPPDTDYDLYLYDSDCKLVAKSELVGSAEHIDYVPDRVGRYHIHIRPYDGRSSRRYSYLVRCSYGAVRPTPSRTSVNPYPPPPTHTPRPPSKTPTRMPKGTATRTRPPPTRSRTATKAPWPTPTPRR